MHKKTHVSIHLETYEKPVVEKGFHILYGDPLIVSNPLSIHKFDLAKILDIPGQKITSYLLVKENQSVKQGQAIARKKRVFSSQLVKTPVAGEFIILDALRGLVGIKEKTDEKTTAAWFDGIVEEVNKEEIVFSVQGCMIEGIQGKGKLASGILKVVTENISTLTMPIDLDRAILVVKEAVSDVIVKADVLGAVAIVCEVLHSPNFSLPYLLVSDITKIHAHNKKQALLYGDKLQLLVLEEDHLPGKK